MPKFLEHVAEHGNITKACRDLKINRRTPYEWQEKDPVFNQRLEEAIAMSVDVLEAEARRRAVEGHERPIYQRGELIGTETIYSDRLLEFLLKGNAPEKYKDRVQHSGNKDEPLIPVEEANKTDIATKVAHLFRKKQEEQTGE